MRKKIKVLWLILFIVVLIYTLFIVEESIRLSNNPLSAPLIIFEESYSGNVGDVTYKSLGFTLKIDYAKFTDSSDMVYPVAEEFWLFDRFLIWGWIS